MEITTSWKEEGRAEGRAEGREEGTRALVLRLLARRLGSLSATFETRVGELSAPDLETLAEDLLDFTSPQDLERWFAQRG